MFDKLEGILQRYEEIMEQLNDPNVVNDQNNYRKIMKEQSENSDTGKNVFPV